MGMNLKLSSASGGTRNIGPINMGGGANLLERSLFSNNTPNLAYSQWYTQGNGSPAISTSDYYLKTGLVFSKPFDLDTAGSPGATIKAREGYRYAWLIWSDHEGNWPSSTDLCVGYSNDPQIWPEPTTLRAIYGTQNAISVVDQNATTQNNFHGYWAPFLAYNPDPGALAPFYIYAEGSANGSSNPHELTLITSSDLQSVTLVGPAVATTSGNGWASFGRPTRLGVNSWEMYNLGKPDGSPTSIVYYRWTSTDGYAWTPNYSTIVAGAGPYLTISGQKYLLTREDATPNSYISLLAVNSSNVSSGTYTRISTGFSDNLVDANKNFPGPQYLQGVDCYEEDGVASIYAARGFPMSLLDGTNDGPYLDNHPSFYDITASITSNVMNVTSWPAGNPPLAIGFRLFSISTITGFGTGTGGTGTYTVAARPDVASQTMTVCTNGGLWQQFIDQYYYITDATAAASAAPLGVKASCTSGTVTIQWNNSLPHQNYRVYRGTTVGTQATLIGTVSGTSITDTPTAGSQYFYKVVTMNVTEQKSRVVSVYASNNTATVNKHVNRVINDGGDITKIDMTFLASADSWLTSNDTYKYVHWWTDVRFGIKLDGSGFIAKIYDLGTTRMPRGGDYIPTTSSTYPSTSSNTSYSTTSFRGTTPSWINNAGTARGYFGGGKANNIQRWSQITMLAAYQKPGTGAATFFGLGEFTGMYFQHESGSAGNITFAMVCDKTSPSTFTNATVPFSSATAAGVVAAVADGTNMIAYLNGTPGTPQSMGASANNGALLTDTVLRGHFAADVQSTGQTPVLVSGAHDSRYSCTARTYNFGNAEAQFTGAGLAIFDKGLSQTLIQSWGALYA